MEYAVRLENLSSQPLAVVRRRATPRELPKVIPAACGVVWNAIRAKGITRAGRHVALYWDGEINLEVGVELDAALGDEGEVVNSATPAGPVAATVHFGPYGRLPEAHDAIRQWCIDQRYELAGPSWEIYGHWTDEYTRDPSKIRTDIFYLLTAGGSAI